MARDEIIAEHRRLVRLMRKIAREEAWQVMDEHVTDYEHKAKPVSEEDLLSG